MRGAAAWWAASWASAELEVSSKVDTSPEIASGTRAAR
jgi:hypothetical protein